MTGTDRPAARADAAGAEPEPSALTPAIAAWYREGIEDPKRGLRGMPRWAVVSLSVLVVLVFVGVPTALVVWGATHDGPRSTSYAPIPGHGAVGGQPFGPMSEAQYDDRAAVAIFGVRNTNHDGRQTIEVTIQIRAGGAALDVGDFGVVVDAGKARIDPIGSGSRLGGRVEPDETVVKKLWFFSSGMVGAVTVTVTRSGFEPATFTGEAAG